MKRGTRILSALVAACMLTTVLPAGALAVEGSAVGFSVGVGDFTMTADTGLTEGSDYEYSDSTLTIKANTAVTISMNNGVTQTTTDKIVVQNGVTADITLDGVDIDVSGVSGANALDVTGADVTLTLAETNTLTSGYRKAGVLVPADSALTIEGDGKLTARGGSGGSGGGAGIGADHGGSCGTITINDGTVDTMAVGEGGAGIGLGGWGGAGGSITISGGCVVSAGGGDEGSFSGDTISVSGGIILAADDKLNSATKENCIVYENHVGQVYGTVELAADHTVPEEYSLTIPSGSILVVPERVTLTNDGIMIIEDGTLTNNGTITNNGDVINAGTMNGSAEIGGNPVREPDSIPDPLSISNGSVTISASPSGLLRVKQNGNYYQGNSDSLTIIGETATNTITVGEGVTAHITMDGLKIAFGNMWGASSPMQVKDDAVVTITLVGDNELRGTSGYDNVSGGDGIQCANSAVLTIGGTGSLSCVGGDGGTASSGTGGWGGVGIRGNATVTGGNITVVGGFSGGNRGYEPGGSRAGGNGFDGTLTMQGGNLTAIGGKGNNSNNYYYTSGNGGAGITALIMSGGTVNATGGNSGNPSWGGSSGSKGNGVNNATPSGGVLVAQGGADGDGGGHGVETLNFPENCIVFSNGTGDLHGDYTLTKDFELTADKTLTVGSGETLTIAEGVTLTNKGTITIDGGTITNNGTIKNSGTMSGTVDGEGAVQVPSTVAVTFRGASGDVLAYAIYGEPVSLVATAAKAQSVGNARLRSARENTVDFYLGSKDGGTKLGTAAVSDIDGVPAAKLEISGVLWKNGFQLGDNTITADFGGTTGLLESVGSATLTVKGRYTEETFLAGTTKRWYNEVTLADTISGFWYLCTTSSEIPSKDAEGWKQANSDRVSFWDLTHLTNYYLWCYVPAEHELYAGTGVYGPITVSTPDGPWASYADISWYENAPNAASYTLTTPEQLAGVAELSSSSLYGRTLYLGVDIDLSAHEWQPTSLTKITFDGQGHAITGMQITGDNYYAGLFSEIDETVLKNFTVSGEIIGTQYLVGGVVGLCQNSTIINVGSLVSIQCGDTFAAGGIVGGVAGSVVCNSYALGSITAAGDDRIENAYFGGIAGGSVGGSSIQNCYYYGALMGADNLGGIAALNDSGDNITTCWSNVRKTGEKSEDGQAITDAATLTKALNDYDLLQSIRESCGLTAVPWTLAAENGAWPVLVAPQHVISQPTADFPLVAVTSPGDAAYQWQTKELAKTSAITETTNDPDYAWTDQDGVWQSSNRASNSSSALTVEYAVENGGCIAFDWKVSSEKQYDTLEYTLTGPDEFSMEGNISGIAMTEFVRVEYTELAAGNYALEVRYSKDHSGAAGEDCGWVNLHPVDWRSIDGFTKNFFPAGGTYTGAQVRCLVTYPWGETLLSDLLTAKEYRAVTFDSRNGEPTSSYSAALNSALIKPADPTRDGYTFGGWYKETACTNAWDFAKDTVTDNVTLYAKWTQNSSGSSTSNRPSAKVDGTGGTVKAGNGTVTITPDEGYRISKITVNSKAVDIPENGKLTGLKGRDKVVVTFEKIPTIDMSQFTDLSKDAWYYTAAEYVVQNGLFNGTSDTTFSPDVTMTRAMLVTVLYRAAGEPSIKDEILGYPFADVDAESWYGTAVYWARLGGIASGTGEETFSPDAPITREQLAVMLYRYAGSPETTGTLDSFTDAGTAGNYATDALKWAVERGIITGKGSGILDPKSEATRAQVAAMLMRYLTAQED